MHHLLAILFATAVAFTATARAQTVRFQDATVAAGVDHLHWDLSHPQAGREILHLCAGAAAGDFDGDGWPDLYVTRIGVPNLLYRNLGDGTFEDVAADVGVDLVAASTGCSWADVNNDGHLDLYVLAAFERTHLFINDGAGGFVEDGLARGLTVGDGDIAAWFTSAAFGDFDRDGDLDLHMLEWAGARSRSLLYENDGTGVFTDVTEAMNATLKPVWGLSTSFADINSDGWLDLLVAGDAGTSRLLLNLQGMGFEDITLSAQVGTDENGMGSAIGDIDNDGDLDWFVTSIYDPTDTCSTASCNWGTSGNRLYRNVSGTLFKDDTDVAGVRDGGWGWGASFFDYDNDGDLDLGMTNGIDFPLEPDDLAFNTDPLRLWENDGTGAMTEVSAVCNFVDTRAGKGFVVFDYDRDGDLDVFIANTADHPILLRNDGGNVNPWLQVVLRGDETNYFGLGARITVQAVRDGPIQMREVSNNSNYLSHNDVTAHFGFPPGTQVLHRVSVEWPVSGRVRVLNDVPVRRRILIHETVRGFDIRHGKVDSRTLRR